jgi:uncharacterized membrane protein
LKVGGTLYFFRKWKENLIVLGIILGSYFSVAFIYSALVDDLDPLPIIPTIFTAALLSLVGSFVWTLLIAAGVFVLKRFGVEFD